MFPLLLTLAAHAAGPCVVDSTGGISPHTTIASALASDVCTSIELHCATATCTYNDTLDLTAEASPIQVYRSGPGSVIVDGGGAPALIAAGQDVMVLDIAALQSSSQVIHLAQSSLVVEGAGNYTHIRDTTGSAGSIGVDMVGDSQFTLVGGSIQDLGTGVSVHSPGAAGSPKVELLGSVLANNDMGIETTGCNGCAAPEINMRSLFAANGDAADLTAYVFGNDQVLQTGLTTITRLEHALVYWNHPVMSGTGVSTDAVFALSHQSKFIGSSVLFFDNDGNKNGLGSWSNTTKAGGHLFTMAHEATLDIDGATIAAHQTDTLVHWLSSGNPAVGLARFRHTHAAYNRGKPFSHSSLPGIGTCATVQLPGSTWENNYWDFTAVSFPIACAVPYSVAYLQLWQTRPVPLPPSVGVAVPAPWMGTHEPSFVKHIEYAPTGRGLPWWMYGSYPFNTGYVPDVGALDVGFHWPSL